MTTAATLTEAHRRLQIRLGLRTVQLMRASWPLLDAGALDASFARWLRVVLPLVEAQRTSSSSIAAQYYNAVRTASGVTSTGPAPHLADPVKPKQLATSMLVTGPVAIRSALARGVPFVDAVATAEGGAARAAMRHTLNGGRATILNMAHDDADAVGWRRIASSSACKFCQMLAGRGAVYGARSVGFQAHDACSCSAAPAFGT